MERETAWWLGSFLLAVLLTLAAGHFAYFPGDVAITRLVQHLVFPAVNWAEGLTRTATFPWSLLLVAMICALSWALAGRRAALLAIVSFVGMWALGTWLNPAMARPRPVPPLVQVVGSPRGYSFPSSFALTYASTWGFLAILAAVKATGPVRLALVIFCSVLLLAGGVARIALGAHWPSDIVISYFLGLLWAAGLIRFLAKA